ncbi:MULTISPECIES: hypothetical protein [Frankia]|uniref:hypothetical protein n=1 Tax=Frankia TaxID=1854 RepID=UPI001E3AD36A|nr:MULTISPECIES: hypothetical protein [Frankia]
MQQPGRTRQPGGLHLARWGKVLGVAGLAGVAATGVLVARDHRHRGAYSPDEIRARLQARVALGASAPPPTPPDSPDTAAATTSMPPDVAGERAASRRGRLAGRLPRRLRRQRSRTSG